jgi:hypothetical protein
MDNLKDLESMQVALKEFRAIGKRNREILLNMLTNEHELLGDTVDAPYTEINKRYIAAGRRANPNGIIPFIKEVREVGKISLKEAKDLVESW